MASLLQRIKGWLKCLLGYHALGETKTEVCGTEWPNAPHMKSVYPYVVIYTGICLRCGHEEYLGKKWLQSDEVRIET